MCGILGVTGFELDRATVTAANATMRHRGPDNAAVEQLDEKTWFGHNRLSIVGLEAASNQPMDSHDGRYSLVFNGEIYNYVEIRQQLEKDGVVFQTRSDTEVLLAAWCRWGEAMLEQLNGMFAFAIYDRVKKSFFLARDRIGVKPLYYHHNGSRFAFASEIQAMEALIGDVELDPVAVDCFFMLGYVPAPKSIWREIRKLQPGHYLRFDGSSLDQQRYWSPSFNHNRLRESDALDQVGELFSDAVRLRLRADVPVGAFLSGGIDSSLVVATMSSIGADTRTFTIGFDDARFDESPWAAQVAENYSDEHTVEILNSESLVSLDRILQAFGEPFADASALPTYYVSELAARKVKVVLSGDGGDELFMGYDKYRSFRALNAYYRFPAVLQRAFEKLLATLAATPMGKAERVRTIRRVLADGYRDVVRTELLKKSRVRRERRQTLHDFELTAEQWIEENLIDNDIDGVDQMIAIDLNISLPDDMLVKVDRASMAHSIEVRNPFLDYRLVELAVSLSPAVKMPGFETKHLLKKLALRHFPKAFVYRAKQGFVPPISTWLGEQPGKDIFDVNSAEGYIRAVWAAFDKRL